MIDHLFPHRKISERLQKLLQEEESRAFLGTTTEARPTAPTTLTLEDLERAVADLDPDGRLLREARLLAACQHLGPEQMEVMIRMAQQLVGWPWDLPCPYGAERRPPGGREGR